MKKDKKMPKEIKTFKGFNPNWTCRGFQYKVGETYEMEGGITICDRGFHGCEDPFDVWRYYNITDSKFAICGQSGLVQKDSNDSKIVSSKITVEAKLELPDFIDVCVNWLIDDTKGNASSGDYSKQASSGRGSKQASSGDYSSQASSGDYSKQASSGDYTHHKLTGEKSVASMVGGRSTCEGVNGSWFSIAEYGEDGNCLGIHVGCIGKDGLKPNTKYGVKNGKLVEV